jgi:hypothetical protein
MRKLIVFSVAFVLAAGAAFAQLAEGITLYSWGSGVFVPLCAVSDYQHNGDVKKDTAYNAAGAGITWGGARPGLVFRIDGTSQYVGFSMAFEAQKDFVSSKYYNQKDALATHEVGANFWVKPFGNDWLKLTLGKFVDDTLRGKMGAANGGFEYFTVYGDVKEDDQIFSRFSTHNPTKNHPSDNGFNGVNGVGFMVSSVPIKGLFIGVEVDGSIYDDGYGGPGSGSKAADVYRYIQAGAGYNLGAAHIRAQYIGGFAGVYDQKMINNMIKEKGDVALMSNDPTKISERPARVEAACSFSGIPNLFFDVGVKAWLPVEFKDIKKQYFNGIDASLGAKYRIMDFNIAGRVDAMHLGVYTWGRPTVEINEKQTDSTVIDIRLVPTYSFPVITAGLDLGCRITGESKTDNGDGNKDNKTELGFGAFVRKSFPNGSIKAGVAYSIAPLNNDGKLNGQNIFQIPIVLEYSFF